MLKREKPQEVFISQMTSIQVYIDEDDVGMWRVCKIENGRQTCSVPQVISLGPIEEIICHKLPGLYRFAVAYLKSTGIAYAKSGKYSGDAVWWGDEVQEYIAVEQWSHTN